MQNPQGYGSNPYGAPPQQPPTGASSTGLQPNVAALLAYVFTWLTGLIFFLLEKENRFVRFHAMQAILYGLAIIVIYIGFSIVTIVVSYVSGILGMLMSLFSLVLLLAFLAGWVVCMVKAYQNQIFKLPVIGNIAEGIVNK